MSLPTYWGVLIQWGGAYLGLTIGAVSSFGPVLFVSWVTVSLCGRVPPPSKEALVCHGATSKHVRAILVAFWKAVLHMSRASHPPQLHDNGDSLLRRRELMAYQALYPPRTFPKAGGWQVGPHNVAAGQCIHTFGTTLRRLFMHVDFFAKRHDSWRFQHPFFAPKKSISFFRPTPRVFSSWDTTTSPVVASRGAHIHPLFQPKNCMISNFWALHCPKI